MIINEVGLNYTFVSAENNILPGNKRKCSSSIVFSKSDSDIPWQQKHKHQNPSSAF
jgi:hypothetical protein